MEGGSTERVVICIIRLTEPQGKIKRLFGIETEYGITLENEAHIDAVKQSIELNKELPTRRFSTRVGLPR